MTLAELKNQILTDNITDDLIILVCAENFYLADQYVEAISVKTGLEKRPILSVTQRINPMLSLVIDYSNYLYILKTETFDEDLLEPDEIKNTIIICNKIDKKISKGLEKYIVEIPKLQDWQVKDYMKALCPGLDPFSIDWAYENMGKDIYRIKNELDKIRLFPVQDQQNVLTALRFVDGSDLYTQVLYKLVEAIVKNNKRELLEFLYHRQVCNIDPIGMLTMLLSNYKKILLVTQKTKVTAKDLGITDEQYKAISYYNKGYSVNKLERVIKVLSAIDLDLKSGRLDIPKNMLFDYILSKTLD